MFTFEYPYAALLIFLPILMGRWKAKSIDELRALKIPHFDQVINLSYKNKISGSSKIAKVILISLWILSCVALMGPKWVGDLIELPRKGRDILLAIDVSESMSVPDMRLKGTETDRLTVVKLVANKFVDKRIGDRLGLILFGTKAYLQTPLTFDRKTIKNMIDDTTIKLAGPLTAIGDAIGLAVKRLRNIESESKVLILLTDGANTAGAVEPIKAAEMAKTHGIKIYTVGLGAEELRVPGIFGTQIVNPSIDLDEDALKAIAQETGGKFFRAFNVDDLEDVYQTIDKLEPNDKEGGAYRPERQLFHYPLTIAFILSMILLLRKLTVLGRFI
jgi:Ca-activated chloride channel family protein